MSFLNQDIILQVDRIGCMTAKVWYGAMAACGLWGDGPRMYVHRSISTTNTLNWQCPHTAVFVLAKRLDAPFDRKKEACSGARIQSTLAHSRDDLVRPSFS